MMNSYMRLRNSGENDERTTSMTAYLVSGAISFLIFRRSILNCKWPACRRISVTPILDISTISVFLNSTLWPCESVRKPSSRACSKSADMSRCVFSNLSKRRTAYSFRKLTHIFIADIACRRPHKLRN